MSDWGALRTFVTVALDYRINVHRNWWHGRESGRWLGLLFWCESLSCKQPTIVVTSFLGSDLTLFSDMMTTPLQTYYLIGKICRLVFVHFYYLIAPLSFAHYSVGSTSMISPAAEDSSPVAISSIISMGTSAGLGLSVNWRATTGGSLSR